MIRGGGGGGKTPSGKDSSKVKRGKVTHLRGRVLKKIRATTIIILYIVNTFLPVGKAIYLPLV